jgi:uncharacterized protein (DUF1800 family)
MLSRLGVGGALLLAVAAGGCARPGTQASMDGVASMRSDSDRDLLPDEQIQHVLNRLGYGARPGDVAAVRELGVDRWIAQQLRPEAMADPGASSIEARYPALTSNRADLVAAYIAARRTPNQRMDPRVQRAVPELQVATLSRAITSERQLYEVMVSFWHNHFSVFAGKGPQQRLYMVEYDRDVIRPRALGKFRDLLGAVAHSPAMLFYLDNHLSRRNGINENYARELLELHTLGVDGGYTQADVIDVARALTGWTIAGGPGSATPLRSTFRFDPAMHDSGAKVVLGHVLPAGRGIEDGEAVLDILARHPSTAKYLAFKLARRLVSDVPPPALVERAAARFSETDGNIAEVVYVIVTSPEFFSRDAFRAKVKTPFEFAVSVRRAFDMPYDETPLTVALLGEFGQPVFGRATPDGWPDVAEAWMNSGAMLKRVLFAADVAAGKVANAPVAQWDGWRRLSDRSADAQAEGVIEMLLGGIASAETRAVMRGASGDGESRLREMIAVAVGAPEFQRR